MEVMYGGKRTLLSAIRPCGMGVIPNMFLDMSESSH